MSSGQIRVWLTEQYMAASAANNLRFGLRLRGALNIAALELGLRVIVGRHEVLRTTFDVVDGEPVQLVHWDSPRVLTVTDLTEVPEQEQEQAAYAVARRAADTPFDLKGESLLRVLLIRLGAEHHILLCTLHHIVADGWSLGLFAHELLACYTAFCEGVRPELQPLSLQYAEYALWEREWLGSEEFRQQLARYAGRLAGASALPLPVGAGGVSATGASRAAWLSPDLVSALKSAASRQGATVFALSLTAFLVLLWQISGREDQVLGVPAAGRNRVEFEDVIGLFTNIVVVHAELSGNPAFADLLVRTKKALVEALAHVDVPFDRLVQTLRPTRSIGGNPIFEILFASVPAVAPMERVGSLTAAPYIVEAGATPFGLGVSVIEEPSGGGWVRAEYRTGVFTAEQIGSLLGHYVWLLAEVAAQPERRIAELETPSGTWTMPERAEQPPATSLPELWAVAKSTADLALEETVTRIWEEVLQRRLPSSTTDFFDLGGHSLQAIAVAHGIGQALGRPIPVSLLFQEPTVAGMARRLSVDRRSRTAATPVLKEGMRPPLFFVGSGSRFRDLGRALASERPSYQLNIFALQEQRLLAGKTLLTTIPELAGELLRDILAIQPEGPYLLAGQCDGGILALEIALQLQAEGRKVALLAQFDTPVNGYYPRLHWTRWLGRRLHRGIEITFSGRLPEFLNCFLQDFRQRNLPTTPEQQRCLQILSVIWQAVRLYRQGRRYPGEIQFFRPKGPLWFYWDSVQGWEQRAERIRVHDVSGSHVTLFSKAASQQKIAQEIERALSIFTVK